MIKIKLFCYNCNLNYLEKKLNVKKKKLNEDMKKKKLNENMKKKKLNEILHK